MYTLEQLQHKNIKQLKEIGLQLNVLPEGDKRCRQTWIDAIVGVNPPLLQLLEVFPAASAVEQVQPIIEMAENSPGVDRVLDPIESNRKNFSGVNPVTESNRNNFSGFEFVIDSNRNNFSGFEFVIDSNRNNFSGVEVDRAQKAIEVQALEPIAPFSAKNPILTGITFSDRFLARYSPPQPEIIRFQSDAGGQLSLFDFEIESVDEPPDPDDFESLDAFREALARWDFEHSEELAVSLDSMCEWAPCPADWYEFDTELELCQVSELSPGRKSSITSDFFIPTFDRLSDRPPRSDEPPDTGIYARLPKPKPPSFPPATVGQAQSKPQPAATQPQAKRIPNAYQTHTCCILAGSSTQPARSPPGGDAGF